MHAAYLKSAARTSLRGKRNEGRIFVSKADDDSSSPSVSRAVLHPNLYVDVCGVSCPKRAVPFISMMVFLCLVKLCVGQTTLFGVAVSWLEVPVVGGARLGDNIQLRVLGLCERN